MREARSPDFRPGSWPPNPALERCCRACLRSRWQASSTCNWSQRRGRLHLQVNVGRYLEQPVVFRSDTPRAMPEKLQQHCSEVLNGLGVGPSKVPSGLQTPGQAQGSGKSRADESPKDVLLATELRRGSANSPSLRISSAISCGLMRACGPGLNQELCRAVPHRGGLREPWPYRDKRTPRSRTYCRRE